MKEKWRSWKFPTSGLRKRVATVPRLLLIARASAQPETCSRKDRPPGRPGILRCHYFLRQKELPRRFTVCWMNDHLAFFAHAHAFGAYSIHAFQGEMPDATLARR